MNDYIESIRKYIGHECLLLVGARVIIYKVIDGYTSPNWNVVCHTK